MGILKRKPKDVYFYDFKIRGRSEDGLIEIGIWEETINNLNQHLGTNYRIDNKKDLNKIIHWYLEDFDLIEDGDLTYKMRFEY